MLLCTAESVASGEAVKMQIPRNLISSQVQAKPQRSIMNESFLTKSCTNFQRSSESQIDSAYPLRLRIWQIWLISLVVCLLHSPSSRSNDERLVLWRKNQVCVTWGKERLKTAAAKNSWMGFRRNNFLPASPYSLLAVTQFEWFHRRECGKYSCPRSNLHRICQPQISFQLFASILSAARINVELINRSFVIRGDRQRLNNLFLGNFVIQKHISSGAFISKWGEAIEQASKLKNSPTLRKKLDSNN